MKDTLFALAFCLLAAPIAGGQEVSFRKDIAPVLVKHCQNCHGPKEAKSKYRVDSYESLLKPGSSDDASITPGKPDASELYKLLIAADKDERMPKKADPLPAATIATIKKWIEQGAKYDGGDPKAALISILPPVEHPAAPATYARPIPITALAFSPDGAAVVAGGYHEVTVWNAADGKLVRRIGGLPQRIYGLAFQPNGSGGNGGTGGNGGGTLAVAGGNPGEAGEVRLVNFADGKLIGVLVNTTDVVLDVKYSHDGKQIACGGADGVVRVFATESSRLKLAISQHSDWVMAVAFSADGKKLASASRDKSAKVYDLTKAGNDGTPAATAPQIAGFTDHNEQVFSIAFAPDGNSVFSGGRDKRIMQWNIADGKRMGEMGGGEVHELLIDGDVLLGAFSDNNLRQFSAKDRSSKRTFSGQKDAAYCVAFHSGAKRVAGGAHDGNVIVWDLEKGTPVIQFVAAPSLPNP